jgi:hypothetical protein
VDGFRRMLCGMSEDEAASIMYRNAARIYRIGVP